MGCWTQDFFRTGWYVFHWLQVQNPNPAFNAGIWGFENWTIALTLRFSLFHTLGRYMPLRISWLYYLLRTFITMFLSVYQKGFYQIELDIAEIVQYPLIPLVFKGIPLPISTSNKGTADWCVGWNWMWVSAIPWAIQTSVSAENQKNLGQNFQSE